MQNESQSPGCTYPGRASGCHGEALRTLPVSGTPYCLSIDWRSRLAGKGPKLRTRDSSAGSVFLTQWTISERIYRFYLCPEGLINVCDLPPRWGLLHAVGRTVKAVVAPMGNLWPPLGIPDEQTHQYSDWLQYQHQPNEHAERQILYSIARRLGGNVARA